jgi:hypothetical protein
MRKSTVTKKRPVPPQNLDTFKALIEEGTAPRPRTKGKSNPKKVPTKKGFRMDSTTFLLTFPQWKGEETLEDLLELLVEFMKEKGREVKEAIICIENHGPVKNAKGHSPGEDPGRHIHMCFKIDKQLTIRDPNYFDELTGKHGDIQSCRDYKACQIYCNKDGNVITKNVDIDAVVESTKSKKGVKHETVANFMRKKPRTIYEVDDKYPGYVLQHQRKCQDYLNLQENKKSTELIPYYGIDQNKTMMDGRDNPELIQLVSWLNNNINTSQPRPHKQKQLWLWGPPNVGKTRLQTQLAEYFNAYFVANEDKWWSGMDSTKEIIFFDEFTGYKCLSDMKRLLEGSNFPMPQKNLNPFIKKKNIPVIICSNSSPEQVYHKVKEEKPFEFDGLMERITVIELKRDTAVPFLSQPILIDLNEDSEEAQVPRTQETHIPGCLVESSQEPPNRPGTPPISPRVLKRGKPLSKQQILECDEQLEMEDQDDSYEIDQTTRDPFEQGEQEDPYEENSQPSEHELIERAKKHFKNLN